MNPQSFSLASIPGAHIDAYVGPLIFMFFWASLTYYRQAYYGQAKRKSSRSGAFLLMGAAMVFVCSLNLTAKTAQAQPTQNSSTPAHSGSGIYRDPAGRYSLTVPAGWSAEPQAQTGINPKGQRVSVLVLSISAGNGNFLTVLSSSPNDQAKTVNATIMQIAQSIRFGGR